MSDFVRLHRWQPTRLPRPWDSPGKNTGAGCHFLLQCMKVKSEKWKWSHSVVSDSWRPHGLQPTKVPPSMGFSRQEYWSGVPLPSLDSSVRDSLFWYPQGRFWLAGVGHMLSFEPTSCGQGGRTLASLSHLLIHLSSLWEGRQARWASWLRRQVAP